MRVFSSLQLLATVDPSGLGKFDAHSLTDQSLFELLISSFEEKSLFLSDADGECKPITEIGVLVVDESEHITSIDIFMEKLGGTLDMRYLPPHLRRIDFYKSGLHGSCELQYLPKNVYFARFSVQAISGSVDLTALPGRVRILDISENFMDGTLDFSSLPDSLQVLFLYKNNFSGSLDLRPVEKPIAVRESAGAWIPRMWRDEIVPALEGTLILNHFRNKFEGDILVSDINRVETKDTYSSENIQDLCRMIDTKGETRELKSPPVAHCWLIE
uniref:Leucine-rich repeat protein n=1 Tax=Paramoeba aestuarina TaxID=180227 RepID=A0A7S4U7H2_9EUKA|mmetsp:Transcript_442/g.745  ORF Transcript_442/g.745 Transcript_442/m.745 type:complete len:272 (+) Transcript_442:19-834(+)